MHHDTPPHLPEALITPPRRRIPLPLAAAALLAAALAVPAAAQQPVRPACTTAAVQSAAGRICGTTDTAVVAGGKAVVPVYRGIPYAKAPTAANTLRWKPTQALPAPDTTMRGTAFGAACPQGLLPDTTSRAPLTVTDTMPSGQSEDCLYLNVWTPPAGAAAGKVPVMVFIHGGAFVIGRGSSPMYDGAYLAAADTVVVVTLNYRLGALGFLYSTAGNNGVAGNFGLLDQQMALRWVRSNIGAFGGDSSRVTLFGESAGAMSTGFHLFQMPSSNSLFRAAIMESNPVGAVYRTPSQAQADGDGYIQKLCHAASGGAQCDLAITARAWFNRNAQRVTPVQVLQAQAAFDAPVSAAERVLRLINGGLPEGLPWTPTVDGQLVLGQPLLGYGAGVRRRPYMFGFNRDEGVLFAALGANKLTSLQYNAVLDRVFGVANADTIRNYTAGTQKPYSASGAAPVAGMPGPASALSNLITDLIFKCAGLVSADSGYSANQRPVAPDTAHPPVFGYLFQRSPVPFMLYDTLSECSAGSGMVCHADELPYVFNTLAWASTANTSTALAPADTSLARQMAAAWGSFAKRPTQAPVSGWTPYTRTTHALWSWSGAQNGPMVTVDSGANCPLWFNRYPLKGGTVTAAAAPPASPPPAAFR
ncbi:MAG TPA: carboxylesterase family protein [Longimicrobium sp.]|jgi:para-nitrobenzyl esterase|uniref:carboxylesterase/lipase family protein n=1 Tax=Longimicrobium sp. TaxID=2029185 RepID=UPI002ED86AE6